MLPYDAVIFDLDGTLTRSEEGIMNSAAYALEMMGRKVEDFELLKSFIGPPLFYSFKHFIGLDEEEAKEAIGYYRRRYNTLGQYENAVYTGIRALLYQLKKQGVYLGIATGKPQEPTESILKYFGLDHFFDKVVGIHEQDHSSSKKELIQKALGGNSYKNAAMVGDRKLDIIGANENQIDAIGVTYGYGDEQELTQAGAGHICHTVEELSEMLLPKAGGLRVPGYFLTMEGVDGSGKSTQVALLEKKLIKWGFDVVKTREPGGTSIGEKIRNLVLDIKNVGMTAACEALLYAAARAQHVEEVIKPNLKKGKLVLCDRFVDSSISYQGGGRELGVKEVAEINRMAVAGRMPDATVYLVIDHEISLERRKQATALDRIEIEKMAFHARVQKAYEDIIEKDPSRFVLVNGTNNPQQVGEEAFEKVFERLLERERI